MRKKKIIKGIIVYGIVFILFFMFRLIYGYSSYPASGNLLQTGRYRTIQDISVKNYASSKVYKKGYANKGNISVDQKYERVASIITRSKNYTKDENTLRTAIKKYKALIQFEQKSGLKGKRKLVMAIGVEPKSFDAMVATVEKIGAIISKNITKTDKTNEYKNLKAKRKSLLKIRNSLLVLKNRSGKIDEFINLENRILDIENKIQRLGVDLGEYDSENEFCTIKFTLSESKFATISFLHRVKVALEWTIKYFLLLNLVLLFVFLSTLILIVILEKLDFIPKIVKKYLE